MENIKSVKIIDTSIKTLMLLIVIIFQNFLLTAQNVAINSTGAAPNSSAMLDISSGANHNLGLLIPRMTFSQRSAITSFPEAAQGLLIYQTDGKEGFYYNNSTSSTPTWLNVTPEAWILNGNTGTSSTTNYLGTTDAVDLVFKTAGAENLRIKNTNGYLGLNQSNPTQRLEIKDGNLLLSNSGTAGQLQFQAPGSSYFTTFKSGALSADINYILPTAQASSANLALVNDGSGNLSWSVPSAGSSFIGSRDNFEDFVFNAYEGASSNDNQYAFTQFVSGTGATSDVDGTVAAAGNDYFGIHILNTGTTATGRAGIGAHNNINRLMLGGKEVIFETRVRVEVLSVAAQTFKSYYGFMDGNAAGAPANGVCFTYTHADNSGKWVAITRSGSVSTTVNSSVTVTANQWYTLKCIINAAGNNVNFYVDDVLIGSSTTNIPTGSGKQVRMVFKLEKSVGTTARTTSIDYVIMRMNR